jgi:monofunctional biosynthetic peptidoglycan transglycosylase
MKKKEKSKSKKENKNLFLRIEGRIIRFFIKLIVLFVLFSVAQVVLLRVFNPPVTVPMITLGITNLFASKKEIMPHHEWRDIKDISPMLIKAVMAGEDQRFISHHGFDFVEMDKAYKDIIDNKRKRARGASTITMQLARTLFLWKDRNLLRKGLEAYYTVLLELFLNKTRIIELYLNTVDWGTGIMGAEAASQAYYKISASRLTDYQAAGMAAILPNPHKWSPVNPTNYLKWRMNEIMRYMGDMHL